MEQLATDKKKIQKLRRRLSSISWFMGVLCDVKLFKWTAKLLQSGQRSTIPSDLAAVLDHLDVKHDAWLDSVEQYEQTFGHAVGRPASLVEVAERMELQHLKGASACRRAFT